MKVSFWVSSKQASRQSRAKGLVLKSIYYSEAVKLCNTKTVQQYNIVTVQHCYTATVQCCNTAIHIKQLSDFKKFFFGLQDTRVYTASRFSKLCHGASDNF